VAQRVHVALWFGDILTVDHVRGLLLVAPRNITPPTAVITAGCGRLALAAPQRRLRVASWVPGSGDPAAVHQDRTGVPEKEVCTCERRVLAPDSFALMRTVESLGRPMDCPTSEGPAAGSAWLAMAA
jgi:hypothetical protein